MKLRIAAALVITLATANVARADVLPIPDTASPAGIALIVGTVVAGAALTAGIVIAGVMWTRRSSRSEVASDNDTGGGE